MCFFVKLAESFTEIRLQIISSLAQPLGTVPADRTDLGILGIKGNAKSAASTDTFKVRTLNFCQIDWDRNHSTETTR